MSETVFYAWQSDLPSRENRRFIRECLDEALGNVNTELGVQDALRADQDTQDVAGDVNVAEVIFRKIDECRIFLADITPISPPGASRSTPNPNVLVEYGRASVKPGSTFVITVFNEAYGNWETDRPFDLRHKRAPLRYFLQADSSPNERQAAKQKFVKELEYVVRETLNERSELTNTVSEDEFADLRDYYSDTELSENSKGRIVGFWIGLLPNAGNVEIAEPWCCEEMVERKLSWTFSKGTQPIEFHAVDALLAGSPHFNTKKSYTKPFQRGAKFYDRIRYPSDLSNQDYVDDVMCTYLREDGAVAICIRTNNLYPVPFMAREWIVAEAMNALNIVKRLRAHIGNPFAEYTMFAELRYDEPIGTLTPVLDGEWRLGTLGDEQGNTGPLLSSAPLSIGPVLVGASDTFPGVLKRLYFELVTSAGRVPESDLDFSIKGLG